LGSTPDNKAFAWLRREISASMFVIIDSINDPPMYLAFNVSLHESCAVAEPIHHDNLMQILSVYLHSGNKGPPEST
jgi:hypothetical protein